MNKKFFLVSCIFLSLLASGCSGLTADSYSNIQSETEGMYFYELADLTNSPKNAVWSYDSLDAGYSPTSCECFVSSNPEYVEAVCSLLSDIKFINFENVSNIDYFSALSLSVLFNKTKQMWFYIMPSGKVYFKNYTSSSFTSVESNSTIYNLVYTKIWTN